MHDVPYIYFNIKKMSVDDSKQLLKLWSQIQTDNAVAKKQSKDKQQCTTHNTEI